MHLHVAVSRWSLCPIVNGALCTGNCFRQNCRPRGSDVNTKGPDTLVGRLKKAGMYPAFIYLFIYLFFVRVSLECEDVED